MGFYPVASLLHDARRHGLHFKPVSVIHSALETTVIDDDTLRLGLQHLKNLSTSTSSTLLEARSHALFIDLPDFLGRVHPSKKERRLLAAAGALDDLSGVTHRRDALWQGEQIPQENLLTHREDCHPDLSGISATETTCPLPPMSDFEKLRADYDSQGYSTGEHPMALLRKAWDKHTRETSDPPCEERIHSSIDPSSLARACDFQSISHGQHASCAGIVICRQRPSTAKGHCFISLEDETGIANLFIPRTTFERYRLLITTEQFLLCHGRMQVGESDSHTLYTTCIEPLPSGLPFQTSSHDFH